MAMREMSSTLRNLKFMQRAAQREDKTNKKEEEAVSPAGNFVPVASFNRKCVVIMEGDPVPGAVIGRMSFMSFNPSIDKLSEDPTNIHRADNSSTGSINNGGKMSFSRQDGSSPDEFERTPGKTFKPNSDMKRKQSEVVPEPQYPNKSPKSADGSHETTPNIRKGAGFKQPKHGKTDWSVLKPAKSRNGRDQRS